MMTTAIGRLGRRAFARGPGPYVVVGIVILCVLVAGGAAYWIAYEKILPREFISEAAVEAEVNRALPRGSTEAEVLDFLATKKWSFDGPTTAHVGWDFGTPDGAVAPGAAVITGYIPHAGRGWWCNNYDLQLYFVFDADQRLDRPVIIEWANCSAP